MIYLIAATTVIIVLNLIYLNNKVEELNKENEKLKEIINKNEIDIDILDDNCIMTFNKQEQRIKRLENITIGD